ncbi:MAG: PD-(D/E)XK motif protein, partial [Actinomycetota bacterium]|nr:PD-(D/E)XK motif protein [Actinomycetota bacterium]
AVGERLPAPKGEETSAILDVLERWRRFLVSAAGPPGRDRLAGVFGELLVLLDLVTSDPRRRVDAWVGPFGSRHDLRRGDLAIEVKTTRCSS